MEFAENMDAAWSQYTRLERRLIQYFNYVPPVEDHYGVWSNELAEILILAGTGFDSFLEAGLYCECFNDFKAAAETRQKKEARDAHLTIGDYRRTYEGFYALSQQPVFLLVTEHSGVGAGEVEPFFLPLKPFAHWARTTKSKSGSKVKSPEWWDAYNLVKHRGFTERHMATLGTVIDTLASYFMVMAVHLCSIPTLARYGVIRHGLGGNRPLSVINQTLVKRRPRDAEGRVRLVPLEGMEFYVAETELFGYAYPCDPGVYKGWLERPFDWVGPTKHWSTP
jgi:hypothetical protein